MNRHTASEIDANCLKSYFYEGLAEYKRSNYKEAHAAYCRGWNKLKTKANDPKWSPCISWLHQQMTLSDRKRCESQSRSHSVKREPLRIESCRPSKRRKRDTYSSSSTASKSWKCKYCPYSAIAASIIERHERIHEREVPHPFACKWCSYSSQNRLRLEQHERLHLNDEQIGTQIGGQIGRLSGQRNGRKISRRKRPQFALKDPETSEEDGSYLSDDGSAGSRSGTDHDRSEWSGSGSQNDHHRGDREHDEVEDEDLSVRYERESRESKERVIECKHCSMRFRSKSALAEHLKTHAVERPLKCPHCDQRFVQKNHLTSHLRIHDPPDDSFLCAPCNLSFRNKTQLKRHRRSPDCKGRLEMVASSGGIKGKGVYDVDEEPAKCPICNKKFQKKKYMVMHMESMHVDPKPFVCTRMGCGQKFRMKEDLDHHIAKQHDR